MHVLLLESDRSFLRSAECAAVSILAHAGVVWLAVGMTEGGRQLPADERQRQSDIIQLGKLGGALEDGIELTGPG